MQRHELIAEVDVLLGGRGAEEVFIGEISTGAGNDLERATDIVKSMVGIYGMSDVAGLMVLEKQRNTFLAGGSSKEYSEKMAENLDKYVINLLSKRYEVVKERLKTYKECIERIVVELREYETLDGDKLREIISTFEKENNMPSLMHFEEDEAKDEDKS